MTLVSTFQFMPTSVQDRNPPQGRKEYILIYIRINPNSEPQSPATSGIIWLKNSRDRSSCSKYKEKQQAKFSTKAVI